MILSHSFVRLLFAAALAVTGFQPCNAQREASPARSPRMLPDLMIAYVRAEPARVAVTVRNVGTATPETRATASLLVGGRQVAANEIVPALSAGEEVELSFRMAQRPGEVFEVVVDGGPRLVELRQDNNRGRGQWPAIAAGRDGVDPLLLRAAARLGTPNSAVARFPDNREVPFVEDELVLTTADQAMLTGLLARTGGVIVDRIYRPAEMRKPPTYVIRVTKRVDATAEFGDAERKFAFSSLSGRDLLATAMRERRGGVPVGINPILLPQGFLDGTTREGAGNDGLSLDYMATGGLFDVDVRNAWLALFAAGKLGGTKPVLLGIDDAGFSTPRVGFTENDLDVASSNGGSPSPINCSGGNPCPWHGTSVAKTAAGLPDNMIGTTGPAGPVARLILIDRSLSGSSSQKAMWEAYKRGARIINMSFGAAQPRGTGWFEGAWPSELEDWEDDTRWLAGTGNTLLFAAAGNEGQNIDAKNGDGDEAVWWHPCENQGVICVGGWAGTNASTDMPGKVPDPGSNYSYPGDSGEVVDISGPYCVKVGDDPSKAGKDVITSPCGTSVASPFVAGVAALIRAANPALTAAQVWQLMHKYAIGSFPLMRGGRVHAYRAVREALMTSGGNFKPVVAITSPAAKAVIGQSPFATALSATAFDVEDGFGCCAATWSLEGKPIATGKPSASFAFAGAGLGPRTLKVRVTDSAGNAAEIATGITLAVPKPLVSIKQDVPGVLTRGLAARFTLVVGGASGEPAPVASGCPTAIWSATSGMSPTGAVGCAPMLTFSASGPNKIMVSYTDKFGQAGSGELAVTIVDPPSGTPVASILAPAADHLYNLDEWIALKWTWTGGVGKPTASWTLTRLPGGPPQPLKFTSKFGDLIFRIGDVTGSFALPGATSVTYRLTLVLTGSNGKQSKPVFIDLNTNFVIG